MDCTDRLYPVLIQAIIQVIFWHYVVNYTRSYILNNCTKSKWFVQWSKKPDGMGGETGQDGIISSMGHMLQSLVGGIFLAFAYYLSSPQLFIMGALSEFSVELLDVKDMITQRFITKKGVWSAERCLRLKFILMLMHHSGAFLSILPACIYYADNPHVQQIGYGLLGLSAFIMVLFAGSSSRDIYNLKERGQFAVLSVLTLVAVIYFRWIITMSGIYWFFYEEWAVMTLGIKRLTVTYLIVIKLFDTFMSLSIAYQVYGYLFGDKGTKKPSKISIASLKRPSSVPFNLMRMCSAPLPDIVA